MECGNISVFILFTLYHKAMGSLQPIQGFPVCKESRCLPRKRATTHPYMMSEYFKSIFNIPSNLNFKVVIKSVHDLKLRAL